MFLNNNIIVQIVKQLMVQEKPELTDKNFRKSMPEEEKKSLAKRMCDIAIQLGGVPTKPINI